MATDIVFSDNEVPIITSRGLVVYNPFLPESIEFSVQNGSGKLSVKLKNNRIITFRANSGTNEYMNRAETYRFKACSPGDKSVINEGQESSCFINDAFDNNREIHGLKFYKKYRDLKKNKLDWHKFFSANKQLQGGIIPKGSYMVRVKPDGKEPFGFEIIDYNNVAGEHGRNGFRIHGSKQGFMDFSSQGCIALAYNFGSHRPHPDGSFCELMSRISSETITLTVSY